MADEYIERLPQPLSADEKNETRRGFTNEFFSGFTSPGGSLIGRDVAEQGDLAGQKFRRRLNRSQFKQAMEDFGYAATEADGTWGVAFEISGFTPRDKPDERWWLDEFEDTKYILPKDGEVLNQPVYYHVSGFLSPKGESGHMGRYDHEFYATKIVYIKSGG